MAAFASSLRAAAAALAVSSAAPAAATASTSAAASSAAGRAHLFVRRLPSRPAYSQSRCLATVADGNAAPPQQSSGSGSGSSDVDADEKDTQAAAQEPEVTIQEQQQAEAAVHDEVAAAASQAVADALSSGSDEASSSGSSSDTAQPIRASVVISRPPLLLRQPSDFESAFFAYNAKLKAAMAQPFPRDFYFKKGSTAEQRFDDAEARRLSALQKGSTDPLAFLPNSSQSQEGAQGGAAAPQETNPDADLYSTMPRTTEADRTNNVKSLNRKLDRTLYLLTRQSDKASQQGWAFPARTVPRSGKAKENLHQAAERAVATQLGSDIDVWLVSNLPIGVAKPATAAEAKTYYMQAHVLAGNVAAEDGNLEFAWLTREEIEERLTKSSQSTSSHAGSWEDVRDFLRT